MIQPCLFSSVTISNCSSTRNQMKLWLLLVALREKKVFSQVRIGQWRCLRPQTAGSSCFWVSQQVMTIEKQGHRTGNLIDTPCGSLWVSAPHSRLSLNFFCNTVPLVLCFHLGTFLVEDVIKYLDPEYIDRIAIPDASKLQFILAGNAGLWVRAVRELGPPLPSHHRYSSENCCLEFWPGCGLRSNVSLWIL